MCPELVFEFKAVSMLQSLDPRKLFANVLADGPVIVAVSGGGDSVALLLLAAAWARQSDVELQVVTVDHGLRPEAAAEAAFVAGISEGLDLPHITLAWDGLKPDSGLSEAARNARYTLLEEFARDIAASAILVGHTLDDQAETIYMRNSRGSGNGQGRGLSGMSSYMLLPRGTRLFRPLLGVYRKQLRQYLTEHHQSWIEDPSNQDASYERVRVRNKLEALPPTELAEICRFGELMGRMRQALATEVASELTENLQIDEGPVYIYSADKLQHLSTGAKRLLFQVLTAISGGAEYFIAGEKFDPLMAEEVKRITVGNAVIESWNNSFRFFREKRNLPSIVVGPGDRAIWDGRLQIRNDSATSYFFSALSTEQLQEIEQNLGRRLGVKPRAVLASTPYFCGDGDAIGLPFVKGFETPAKLEFSLVVRAIEHFCPEFDFALLEFVDALKQRMASLKPHKS